MSNTNDNGDIVSHYRTSGHGSFKFSKLDNDDIRATIYTDHSPDGFNLTIDGSTYFNDWHLFTIQYQSEDFRLYIDGQQVANSVVVSGNLLGHSTEDYDLSIGGESTLGFQSNQFTGKFGCLIISSGFHNNESRSNVESHLLHRYTRQY